MRTFRYDTSKRWYKGNVHVHSTKSDGGKDFRELADVYAESGYDFLFRTDHWVVSDAENDSDSYPLLWLDGVEINGVDDSGSEYHLVGLGSFEGIDQTMGFVPALEAVKEQGGVLVVAHPQWTGNSQEDVLRWEFDGVEVYNHVCRWLNGKSDGTAYWNMMLEHFPNTLAFAVDDAHINPSHPHYPGWNGGWHGGWIMVNAESCAASDILSGIRGGNFYSTCGPEFYSIDFDGTNANISCSPVEFIRLAGSGSQGRRLGANGGHPLTRASFNIPEDWPYAYIEIEDGMGRRAWTNPLFVTAP